jgi:hypothetical protein
MAIWLYRQARGAFREYQAKKAVTTADDSCLVPETISYVQNQRPSSANHIELGSLRASHSLIQDSKKSAQEDEDTRQRNIQQWRLFLGLVLPNFLAAVDVTIVAPAIPLISSDFSVSSSSCQYIPLLIMFFRPFIR